MRLRACGDLALLVDGLDPTQRRALGAALRTPEAYECGVLDAVPGARTLVVHLASPAQRKAARDWLPRLSAPESTSETAPDEHITLETRYEGADLADVAAHLGWSEEAVRQWHTGQDWVVDFCGFVPGFAYLTPTEHPLDLPRRASPRTQVPAGAVGLAGGYSGVYPRPSSGGWQLIGHADAALWDLTRESPALLRPGHTVRFRESDRPRSTLQPPAASVASSPSDPTPPTQPSPHPPFGLPVLRVERVGALATIQDQGRTVGGSLGVTGGGAIDRHALALANRIVGNPESAAGLEILMGNVSVVASRPCVVAATGAPIELRRNGIPIPFGEQAWLNRDDTLSLGTPVIGLWTYLAVAGGLEAPTLLGSRSASPSAGLGPRPLQAGDDLSIPATPTPGDVTPASTTVSSNLLTGHERLGTRPLGLILGPRDDWFTPESIKSLWRIPWTVTSDIDRVGMRLTGPTLERRVDVQDAELASEGVVRGSVQVSPQGELIVFLADHPTTGGYPVVGVIADADLDALAQHQPGDTVTIVQVSPSAT